jgi:prepilin-type N-terminal cleavage/methylation domain-containing protein
MSTLNRRGLTLLELLVTVVVMSIAAAVVIPSMGSTGVLRVQAAARTIVADMTVAQTEAMAFQSRRAVYFGVVEENGALTSGNGYAVLEPTSTLLSLENINDYTLYMPDDPSSLYARSFGDPMRYGGAEIDAPTFDDKPVLIFDELGGPLDMRTSESGSGVEAVPGSGGSVRVVAPALNLAYRITVDPMTGRVDVLREGEAPSETED